MVKKKMTKKVVHLAIFASGGGTNAGKIMEYFSENESVRVVVVICNKPRAGVVGVAAAHAVPVHFIDRNSFCHTTELVDVLRQYRADWLVLAGFLWLIPPYIVESFPAALSIYTRRCCRILAAKACMAILYMRP